MRFNMNLLRSGNLVTRTVAQISLVAVVAAVSTSAVSSSAFATLDSIAYNSTAQSISSGTLLDSITVQTGTAGFGQGFSATLAGMNPGDTRTVVVDYFNYGTDTATSFTLSAGVASANALTNEAGRGLQVVVTSCQAPWGYAVGTGVPTCTTPILGTNVIASPLSTLITSNPNGIAFSTATSVAANAHLYLRFSFGLPNQTEIWVNGAVQNGQVVPGYGTAPAAIPNGTITGLTANLTWIVHATASVVGTSNA